MVDQTQVDASKAIQRQTGKTFHVATRLLPERVRHATYVLYAFFRIADEVVDDASGRPADEQRAALDRLRSGALGIRQTDDPILTALRDVCERNDIPNQEIEEFIAAMERDVTTDRYGTYADLEEYLRGSSVAVAYMMLAVMDPEDSETARPHAKALGEAFQLTNFLRDVREDILKYGRIYLPETTLDAHGVSEAQIERLEFSESFAAAMRDELRRTERLYRKGVAGIDYLPADCQFGVLLAAVLYAEHHRLIRERGYDVLIERPTLATWRRVALSIRAWWHWRQTRDPTTTFYRVSAVPRSPSDADNETAVEQRPSSESGSREARCRITGWTSRTIVRPARHVMGMLRSQLPVEVSK